MRRFERVRLAMSPAEILYYDLLGVVLVFTADVFRLWEPWTRMINSLLERVRERVQYRRL